MPPLHPSNFMGVYMARTSTDTSDKMPIFADPAAFETLIKAFETHVRKTHGHVDVVVGLDARGFLFGPTLALRLGAGFVPVRKQGKLPGDCITAEYVKEYGKDVFCAQRDAIKPAQKVLIVDDICATGNSAAAAGRLVRELGGVVLEYLFMMELDFLHGRDLLDAPAFTLLRGQ